MNTPSTSLTVMDANASRRSIRAYAPNPGDDAASTALLQWAESAGQSARPRRSTAASAGREIGEKRRRTLLVCGILSSLLYGAMIGGISPEGYSRISQAPSELSAIGAPTRSLWTMLGAAYMVLVTAFGWGVWKSAGRNRALRIVGGLLVAYGSLGLLWPFARCTNVRCSQQAVAHWATRCTSHSPA